MVLDPETKKKILDFVYVCPRSVDEVAKCIDKNWRTANSYIEKISEEDGSIALKTFRKGSHGALKIVYWQNLEKLSHAGFQQRIEEQIFAGRQKSDFSPSEIFQHIDHKKRSIKLMGRSEYESAQNFEDYKENLEIAEKEIIFFSGNLTFSTKKAHDKQIFNVVEELAKRNIRMKILTRVEPAGIENVKNLLSINHKLGKSMIEIRHCYQPLRVTITDSKMMTAKEVLNPEKYAPGELKEESYIIYSTTDEEWIGFMQKVFNKLFRKSIAAEERIRMFESIGKN